MTAFREHLGHHPGHMVGCGVAALVLVMGTVLSVPALAFVGGVACGAMCLLMVRMIFTTGRTH
jgi:hypothetical protein